MTTTAEEGISNVSIRSGIHQYHEHFTFEYSSFYTPVITNVCPDFGVAGSNIILSGTGFGPVNFVYVGNVPCQSVDILKDTSTTITCILGDHLAGTAEVKLHVQGKGFAISGYTFKYFVVLDSVIPTEGTFILLLLYTRFFYYINVV